MLEDSGLSSDDDGEQEPEPVKILEASAVFDELTIWGHDSIPNADDPFIKAIDEWIAFAEAIHCPSTEDGASESKT